MGLDSGCINSFFSFLFFSFISMHCILNDGIHDLVTNCYESLYFSFLVEYKYKYKLIFYWSKECCIICLLLQM